MSELEQALTPDIKLGKITSAEFGFGGYQDAMIGLTLQFEGMSWAGSTFIGNWSMDRRPDAKWTEEDRQKAIFDAVWVLRDTLRKAKKMSVTELKHIPVECTFQNGALKAWRILEEVL